MKNDRAKPAEPLTLAAWWRDKRTVAKLRWPLLQAVFAPEPEFQQARRAYEAAYRAVFGPGRDDTATPDPGSTRD